MNIVQIRWIVVGSLALALSGCEVHKCTDKDEDGRCADLLDDDEDAGDDEEDAGALDGGSSDGGRSDGGPDGGTDGGAGEGGADGGGGSDASATTLTIEQFCEAQFAKAVLWRDALEDYCGNDNIAQRDEFLQLTFAYSGNDPVGTCIDRLDSSNITFDGTKAAACAEEFTEQFPEPPTSFPESGVDLSTYTATVAHGGATLVQISECRAAFKGKLARDAVCTTPFECTDGLRCLTAPGDTTTCQPALTGGVCLRSNDCADGYTCVGSSASGGKTCVSSDDLPLSGNCQFSIECAEDRICNNAGRCVAPMPDVICAP